MWLGGGASIWGRRVHEWLENATDSNRGTEPERDRREHTMIGQVGMDGLDGRMQFKSFLNADRQRERIAVIRTQDDDSIQPWKWQHYA